MYEGVIEKLYQEYTMRGFLSENYIFKILEENGISLFDVEYVCDHLLLRGVIIHDEASSEEDEYDKSNIGYEDVFMEILKIDDSLAELIEYIRGIQAPQYREWQNLMPQVRKNVFARNRIFEMYMRVAVRIALTYAKKYQLPLDDTIQNALMGLHISIDKYETSRQDNFSQYFPFWVRQFILRDAQMPNSLVYLPAHVKEKLFTIYDNIDNIGDYISNIADDAEPSTELLQNISGELECSLKEARRLLDCLKPFESLEVLMEKEDNEWMLSDEGRLNEEFVETLALRSATVILFDKLKQLTPREQDVLLYRYGIGCAREHTLEEIGNKLNITRERIRQIESKAIRKLRTLYKVRLNKPDK